MNQTTASQKLGLIFFGILTIFLILEIGIRSAGYALKTYQNHKNQVALNTKSDYRILCLGESTTHNQFPVQLQKILDSNDLEKKFTVFDAGVPSIGSSAILAGLDDYLETYRPDIVVTMIGINDGEGYSEWGDKKIETPLDLFDRSKVVKLLRLINLHAKSKISKFFMSSGIAEANEPIENDGTPDILKQQKIGTDDDITLWKEKIIADPSILDTDSDLFSFSKDRDVLREIAELFASMNRNDLVELLSKKTIEKKPKLYWPYYQLASLYDQDNKPKKAKEIWGSAIKNNPEDDYLPHNFAWFLYNRGDRQGAYDVWESQIAKGRAYSHSYYNIAYLYFQENRMEDAKRIIEERLKINPDTYRLIGLYAQLLYQEGNYKEASIYFNKTRSQANQLFNPKLLSNYRQIRDKVLSSGARLIAMQYPIRDIQPLKDILGEDVNIIYVENKRNFKEAFKEKPLHYYFTDLFGGDFGHCTEAGNTLIAKNLAKAILNTARGHA